MRFKIRDQNLLNVFVRKSVLSMQPISWSIFMYTFKFARESSERHQTVLLFTYHNYQGVLRVPVRCSA